MPPTGSPATAASCSIIPRVYASLSASPANRPVTFRLTSADVIHGFEIVGTNGNTMVVPGYVSQFTTTFRTPGEYLIVCNEYCGLMHHGMVGKVIVK